MRHPILGALALTAIMAPAAHASVQQAYEVWAQSNSAGRAYGGTLYIWNGHDLENKKRARSAPKDVIALGGAATALCMASTGAFPLRPHMMSVSPAQSHVIISYVATGHVLFMNGAARTPVGCFRTTVGAGGARQAHMSTPSPDGTYVVVAYQKKIVGSISGGPGLPNGPYPTLNRLPGSLLSPFARCRLARPCTRADSCRAHWVKSRPRGSESCWTEARRLRLTAGVVFRGAEVPTGTGQPASFRPRRSVEKSPPAELRRVYELVVGPVRQCH